MSCTHRTRLPTKRSFFSDGLSYLFVKNFALCESLDQNDSNTNRWRHAVVYSARHSRARPPYGPYTKTRTKTVCNPDDVARLAGLHSLSGDLLSLVLSFTEPEFLTSAGPVVSWQWNRTAQKPESNAAYHRCLAKYDPTCSEMEEQIERSDDVKVDNHLPAKPMAVSCTLEWLHSLSSFYRRPQRLTLRNNNCDDSPPLLPTYWFSLMTYTAVSDRFYKALHHCGPDQVTIQLKKLDGRKLSLQVNLDMPMNVVRDYLAEASDVPSDHTRLIHLGLPCWDATTLRQHRMKQGSVLHVILQIRCS
jgi:hypothetical protein